MDPKGLLKDSTAYQELDMIGTGAYGTVFKARDKSTNTIVALKKVRVPLDENGIPMNTLREICLLKQLDSHEHPNIVRLLDICHGQRTDSELIMYLVFEHVTQDLAQYMSNCNSPYGLGTNRIKSMAKELLSGVEFLHTHRIVHRDLKPQNLLVTSSGHIKLADFGLAKTYDFDMKLTSVVVTLWYRAPEVLLGLTYATPVDLWSVGCIIAELYSLKPLFAGTSDADQLSQIFRILGKPKMEEWPEDKISIKYESFYVKNPSGIGIKRVVPNLCEHAQELIESMLSFTPSNRITAAKALTHPYFTDEPIIL